MSDLCLPGPGTALEEVGDRTPFSITKAEDSFQKFKVWEHLW
jgi:hypothetical protein